MPPWIMWLDADEAPDAKSPRSTSTTSMPCRARSRKVAMPLMPPPITSTFVRPRCATASTSALIVCFVDIRAPCIVHRGIGTGCMLDRIERTRKRVCTNVHGGDMSMADEGRTLAALHAAQLYYLQDRTMDTI